ncbi:hypothetical protein JW911_01145 [Candidatus Peregrinibacteria bacterium]|nr:hypothetical protein [Candidatus Peregrinibacteria bacterium]
MKKIYIYISAIIFTAAACASNAHNIAAAADTAPAYSNAVDELLDQVKGKKKSFTGENLYLEVYKSSTGKAAENTTKGIADKYGVSKENIEKIVKNGDITSLIESDKNATLAELQIKYLKITNDYKTTLETENLRNNLEAQASPGEIYADGNTSNSDFDLLYDLNVIETILFDKSTPSSFTNQFKNPAVKIISSQELEALRNLFKNQEQREAQEARELITKSEDKKTPAETLGTNPLSCFESDDTLINALSTFNNQQQSSEAQTQAGTETDGQEATAPFLGAATSENLPKAPPDDWKSTTLCAEGQTFCITIDFEMKLAELGNYPKEANCIACHVQKINEELDKILTKPTTPNKLPGNLLEMPKCKTGFVNIATSMNIITKAVPPPLQDNKNVFHNINIDKEWQKIIATYTTPKAASTATRKALMDAPPNATLEEIQKRTVQMNSSIQQDQQQNLQTAQKENQSENKTQKFQLLIGEINKMNSYFKSIKENFEKLKKPCEELASKAKCP